LLAAPVINSQAVDREKHMMLETIRARLDNPGQVVSQMFIDTIFKGHPYERDIYGTNETIERLNASSVEKHRQKMVGSKNLTVVVTGAVNRDRWLKGLEKASSAIPKGERLLNNFKYEGPKENTFDYKKMDREQSHIIVGWKGLTLTDERRYTLQIIQSILAGQGGRLFIELRDKASLAYTVAPMRMEGIDAGYFGAYIGCSPEKGPKAIAMMHEEFKKLIDTPISEAELDRAKRYLVGRHDIDLQRTSAIGSGILFNEIYGIDPEETFHYADHLKGITPKDVQKLARELFTTPAVTCAVGRERPW
jgi:zinc protease